jgi:hypothetical protein
VNKPHGHFDRQAGRRAIGGWSLCKVTIVQGRRAHGIPKEHPCGERPEGWALPRKTCQLPGRLCLAPPAPTAALAPGRRAQRTDLPRSFGSGAVAHLLGVHRPRRPGTPCYRTVLTPSPGPEGWYADNQRQGGIISPSDRVSSERRVAIAKSICVYRYR